MYLGGMNQSGIEKRERVERCLRPLTQVNLGWPWQCRCGYTKWVQYRGRFYCWHCGKRQNHPDEQLHLQYPTFRQAFEEALE